MKKFTKYIWTLLLLPATTLAAPLITDPKGEPTTTAQSVTDFINNAQNIVSGAAGAIAVAMIVYGAVIMGTAGGNEEKIGKGKKILTYSIGGIILILLARILIRTFVELLGGNVS